MNTLLKYRKFLWGAAALLIVMRYGSCLIGPRRQAFAPPGRPALSPRPGKGQKAPSASPMRGATDAADATAQPQAGDSLPDPAALGPLLGKWQGTAVLMPGSGYCTLELEIRENQEKGAYAGYSTMGCIPSVADMIAAGHKVKQADAFRIMEGMRNRMSAILVGTAADGSIQFQVDKNLGSGCAMTVMPFGTDQIAAEFKGAAACQGTHMVLRRVGR